jgi:large subunit ribosomal protein L10
MAISKAKKKEIVQSVADAVKGAGSVVFVNFHGLTVLDSTVMRKQLKGQGVGYLVAKKTLAKRALADSGVQGELPALEGEFGLVYGSDLIAPAREVYSFQKKLENKISILGGIFEGKYMTKEEMTVIAEIPPMKTLYAQLVNLINSPLQGLAMALNEIAKTKEPAVQQ